MQSKESLIITQVVGENRMDNEGFKTEFREGQKDGSNEGLKGGSLKMTVETETVQVSASSLAPKLRKGLETMKGSRAKKKRSRLANVASKSEAFAAKIASAIDENIDSDSDETFVYETNTRSPYQLSRTSSVSSIVSHSRHADGKMCPSGKHSMKFTNHSWSSDPDHKDPFMMLSDFTRSPGKTFAFPSSRTFIKMETGLRSPHRIGSRTTSCPSSPHYKYQKLKHYNGTCRRHFMDKNAGSFYTTHEELYPHERIPLLYKDIEYFGDDRYHECRQHNRQNWYISFSKLGWILFYFIIFSICIGLFVIIARPLQQVKVVNITNILVSSQALIMDFEMVVFNPNFWQVSVQQTDLSIFSSKPWSDHDLANKTLDHFEKVSELTFRKSELAKNIVQNNDGLILLGRVFQLDIPFVFLSAFWNKSVSRSIARFHLENPGYGNFKNGSFIWDHIIQHEFQLVIKGFLKYSPSFFSRTKHLIQIDELVNVYS